MHPRIVPKMHEHPQFNNHKIDKTIIKKSIKNTIKHHPNFALVLNPVSSESTKRSNKNFSKHRQMAAGRNKIKVVE